MSAETFTYRTHFPYSAERVYEWHLRPLAFERLCAPWDRVDLIRRDEPIGEGSRVEFAIHSGPLRQRWVAEHRGFVPGRQFRDVQISGPFRHWEHTHLVEPDGPDGCFLEDRIEYSLPGGAVGKALAGSTIRKMLERTFRYRHHITSRDLMREDSRKKEQVMRIAITGASGMVGSALTTALTRSGHQVVKMVRRQDPGSDATISWNPDANYVDAQALEGIDVIIHLAGEGIADARWTPQRKARIRDSRVKGTRLLSETLAQMANPPKHFLCASAIGFYGDRGDETLDETSSNGNTFLSGVCREWEQATEPAQRKGIRVVNFRFGVILSPKGGALSKMLLPFKMGVGGVVGSGKQFLSWISLDDVVGVIEHAVTDTDLKGPINVTAPRPVTNAEFTRTLGKVLGRPTVLPMPAFAARLAFGEMAEEMLLGGAKVMPVRLQQAGYQFQHPELEPALRYLLGK